MKKVQGCLGSRAGSLDSVVMASLVRGGSRASRAGWVSEQKPDVGGAWLLELVAGCWSGSHDSRALLQAAGQP